MKLSLESRIDVIQDYIIRNGTIRQEDGELLLQIEEPSREKNMKNMTNRKDNIYENDSDLDE